MRYSLYYPSIEMRDADFLKRSLLVWDRIYRIVPRGYEPVDDPEVKEAIDAGRFVDLHLELVEKEAAAEGFLTFYQRRQVASNPHSWPAGFGTSSFTRLNPEKIDARLAPLFEQLAKHSLVDGFWNVPHEIAGGYMFYLSRAVALHRSLNLLTDSADSWVVGTYFDAEGQFDDYGYRNDGDAYLCNMTVSKLLPKNLQEVSMDRVLRFSEDHAAERQHFLDEVDSLRKELTGCASFEQKGWIANDFVRRVEDARAGYAGAVGAFSRRELSASLSVGLPVAASIFSLPVGGSGDPLDLMKMSASILIGGVAALCARNAMPIGNPTGSYLIAAGSLEHGGHYRLARRFEEFMND